MKTKVTKFVEKTFKRDNLFVEIEKCLEFKHPFTLSSDKENVENFRLVYSEEEIIDDDLSANQL